MTTFHHGITAQEKTQGILPMRNANVSVLGLIVTSTDADADMYPDDTPVLLTGITQTNIDKAGTDGTLRRCLTAIRDIHNPTIVVLRLTEPVDPDALDVLLECQSRFGLMPKRLGAPEIDTPDIVRKLVTIAKKRRGMVYAQSRNIDGTLITDKAGIAAYRDTFGDRELCLIDGEWGIPTSKPDNNSGNETGVCEPTYTSLLIDPVQPTFGSVVTARYRINGGAWNDYSRLYEDGYDPLFQFFEHLSDASMPHQIVEPSGSGRHAAFRAHPYNWAIWGAERTEPYSYSQESVVTAESTTIDFVVFDQGSYDLIANYFGEDTTIKSCALAKWMGE